MVKHWHRIVTMAICFVLALGISFAQNPVIPADPPPAPGTNDNPVVPADPPPPPDDDVTPPPTITPTLPASAKRPSMMIKQGDMELELRLSYSHFSKSSMFIDGVAMLPVLVVGQVAVENSRRDILIGSAALRYGIFDNFEGEIKVPYRFQHERRAIPDASPPQEMTISGAGLGDIEGTIYYQLPQRSPNAIRWITSMGVKSASGKDIFSINSSDEVPMGSGFWSSKFGLTGVKVLDPVAIYWNLGYTYNWERKNIRVVSEDQTTGDPIVSYVNVKPGNTYDAGGGFAYALNPKFSLNTGLSVSFNSSTTSNGRELVNTAITSASLRMGVVWVNDRNFPIDLSLAIGLTDDSPDFTLEFRKNFQF